ncbi:MAG: SWIM zinc finger family protein [Labilithrix sp.]|nr:SWIM zinc finger family protein [Labilithrix sp.]MCW5836232.1 SWIM zinc finger family protein [Labilithrix sp.]
MQDARAATPFAHVLHRDVIARLARGGTLARGRAYAAEGRVLALAREGGQIVGAVRGSAIYAVSLWVTADGLGYVCSCPAGAEGDFCKHCVAVAIVWVDRNPPP